MEYRIQNMEYPEGRDPQGPASCLNEHEFLSEQHSHTLRKQNILYLCFQVDILPNNPGALKHVTAGPLGHAHGCLLGNLVGGQ